MATRCLSLRVRCVGIKSNFKRVLFALALIFYAAISSLPIPAQADTTPQTKPLAWPASTEASRPWSFWWWMGSAVDKKNILKELTRYHDAGWGGVHIIPIYGAIGSESKYIDYLSPQWMDMLNYTVTTAKSLGMGVDMTTGTGWCFGGPTVSNEDGTDKATAQTFSLEAGAQLQHQFPMESLQALAAFSPDKPPVDLMNLVGSDGSLSWTAPGNCVVYAVLQKPTLQKVKRAAPGGVGLMLNPFYPPAMQHFLDWFTKAFAGYTGAKPHAMFVDSWEYTTNWSPDLFAQFEKRRGYKLQTQLPAMFGKDASDQAARVKSDYRETLSDILTEVTYPMWVSWCHQQGFLTRFQAHGAPGNLLDLYATADTPETEAFTKDRSPLVSKFASSAAHVAGHPLASSETGTWLAEHFTETLSEVKYLIDDFFLGGINHITFHGTCYSPDEAAWPGWCFYASTEMNPRNSIWHDVPALASYITHCEEVLQAGKPDNDVLIYYPIYDVWNNPKGMEIDCVIDGKSWFFNQTISKTAQLLWSRGYAFDYISDRQLTAATTANGQVQVPGGTYRAVVVPTCDHMPVKTLAKLLDLARSGVTVVFENQLPTTVPGLSDFDKNMAEFTTLIATAKLDSAHVLVGDVEKGLASGGIAREPMTDHSGVLFIRRSIAGGHYYFIANRGDTAVDDWTPLSVPAQSVVMMDPASGRTGVADLQQTADGKAQIHLHLESGQSIILRTFTTDKVQGDAWNDWQPDGTPVAITGTWKVKFDQGGPTLPADFQTAALGSWADQADPEAQRFAGSATYSISFDAPSVTAAHWAIDLGQVCQSARVKLNGKDLGTVYTMPFSVGANALLPKGNLLEVEVTNVSANRIRDLDKQGVKWKIFHDINIVSNTPTGYKPFNASQWPLTPSGLLGPVTLQPEKALAATQ